MNLGGNKKMATKKKTVENEVWPKISQGTHLTVKTYENGHTVLEWDDEQLLKEVQAAILKAESVLPVDTKPALKVKTTRTKKIKE